MQKLIPFILISEEQHTDRYRNILVFRSVQKYFLYMMKMVTVYTFSKIYFYFPYMKKQNFVINVSFKFCYTKSVKIMFTGVLRMKNTTFQYLQFNYKLET